MIIWWINVLQMEHMQEGVCVGCMQGSVQASAGSACNLVLHALSAPSLKSQPTIDALPKHTLALESRSAWSLCGADMPPPACKS